jgi:hypothetical protein
MLLLLVTALHLTYLPILGVLALVQSMQTQQRYLQAQAKALPSHLRAMPLQLLTAAVHLLSLPTLGVLALVLNMQTQQRRLQA